jgi:hypothetical protein
MPLGGSKNCHSILFRDFKKVNLTGNDRKKIPQYQGNQRLFRKIIQLYEKIALFLITGSPKTAFRP